MGEISKLQAWPESKGENKKWAKFCSKKVTRIWGLRKQLAGQTAAPGEEQTQEDNGKPGP